MPLTSCNLSLQALRGVSGVKKHRGLHPLRMQVDPWCSNKRRLTKPHYQDLGPKVAGQRLCLPLEHQEQEGKPGEGTPRLMTAEKREKERKTKVLQGEGGWEKEN